MTRIFTFLIGAAAYALFLATFLYAIGFIGNLGVPKSMDLSAAATLHTAVLIDRRCSPHNTASWCGLTKRFITRVIPQAIERSTYVLASSATLLLRFWQWHHLGGVVWLVDSAIGRSALYVGYVFGWLLVLITTFVIDYFDLFGLRQVWRHFMGKQDQPVPFVTPFLYRIVRHPLYVGWLFAFWCAPVMTMTHLFFAAMTAA